MVTKSDIEDKVRNRVSGIPTTVTDAMIEEWVEDAHLIIENRTNDNFATSDIPTEYQAIITDIAVTYLLDYMIEERISIGEISLNYQDLLNKKQALEEKIERQFLDISRTSSGAITTTEPLD